MIARFELYLHLDVCKLSHSHGNLNWFCINNNYDRLRL